VRWYSKPSLKPASANYGFTHSPDTMVNASCDSEQVTTVWGDPSKFNLTDAVTNGASAASPYGGRHPRRNRSMLRGNETTCDVVGSP
jgi:hypothetical protein